MRKAHRHTLICCIVAALVTWSPSLSAHHKPNHVKSGGAAKKSDAYKSFKRKGKASITRGGPPPWAPAHGYRKKYQYQTAADAPVRQFDPRTLITLSSVSIGRCNRETLGAVLGAVAGGAVGAKLVEGDNKILASIGGAVVGGLIGGNIGRAMDQVDQGCVGQILERAPTGSPIAWRDPDHGMDYNVTPSRTYKDADGRHCREYQTSTVIGGKVESAKGTACRKPDGTWETAN